MPFTTQRPRPRLTLQRVLLFGLLLLSAVYLVLLSRARLFWNDEALTFYTVHHRSFAGLFAFQASTPVVLEPPTHDLIEWVAGRLLGYSKVAFRLPSLLFFLLLQWLLYRLTSLLGGTRAGLLAALLMIGTLAASYGAEARPYALLTALTLAAPLLWYLSRAEPQPGRRTGYAAALAAVIALAVTAQFLGALVVYPVLLAEAVFCLSRRCRPDLRILAAVAVGLGAIALDVPYLRAVRPYRPAVPFNVAMHVSALPPVYLWGFLHEPDRLMHHLGSEHYIWLTLLGSLVLSIPFARRYLPGAAPDIASRRALWAALAALALYPVPILLLAHFVTHYFQPRYAVQCVPGLVALLAVVVTRFTGTLGRVPLAVLGLAAVAFVLDEDRLMLKTAKLLAAQITDLYPVSPAVHAFLLAHPDQPVFLTVDECILYPFYGDPALASRVRCLYSPAAEQRFANTQLTSITTRILTERTDMPLRAASYEEMHAQGNVLFAYFQREWLAWLPAAILADHAQYTPLGTGFGGTVVQVSFPSAP